MKKIAFNTCCALVVIGLAQTAYADLNIDGTDNASWPSGGHLNSPATYTSAATDPTSVSLYDIQIGGSATGSLTVNSGTLNVAAINSSFIIGQTSGNGTVTVNGGTLNFSAAAGDVMIGNWYSQGTVNMNGGYLNIDTATLDIGRDGSGVGRVNINGGTLTTTASSFYLGLGGGSPNSTTSGILTFGLGNGVLDFSDGLSTIQFGALGGANYINFLTGSDGKLEINGWTQSQFEALVNVDKIRINGSEATADDFTYIDGGGYQLVTAPEPSSLAMICFGLLSAGTLIRRRK